MDPKTLTPKAAGEFARRGFKRYSNARTQRRFAFDYVAGRHYNAPGIRSAVAGRHAKDATPINLGAQQLRTLVMNLAYSSGDPEVEAKFGDLEFEAQLIESALDHQNQKMRTDDDDLEAIIDATLSPMHIRKIGLTSSQSVFMDGDVEIDAGQFFDDPVDFDDYFPDPDARREGEFRGEGHRYRLSRAAAISSGILGVDAAPGMEMGQEPGMQPGMEPGMGAEGGGGGEGPLNPYIATKQEAVDIINGLDAIGKGRHGGGQNKVSDLSQAPRVEGENGDDLIELWDLIVYGADGQTTIFTFACNAADGETLKIHGDKFLNVMKWTGYGRGPLEKLFFMPLPGNPLPLSLEQMQRDMSLVADALGNKLIRQMLACKTLPVVDDAQTDLGNQAAKAKDGTFLVGDAKNVGQIEFKAMLDQLVPGIEWVKSSWNDNTGNLSLASGQGDVGDTATEFAGLMGKVTGWMNFLRKRVEDFGTRRLCHRAHYFISDPTVDEIIPYSTPFGTVPIQYNSAMRSGGFDEFSFKIRAFSTGGQDPMVQMKRLVEVFSTVIPAVLSLAQTGMIDPQKAMRMIAAKFDLPELQQILMDPTQMMQLQAMQALGPAPDAQLPSTRIAEKKSQQAGGAGIGGPQQTTPAAVGRGAQVPMGV